MAEPTTAAGVLGVKYAVLVAGFAGGVVSLSYVRPLTRLQSAMAVISGALFAGYVTPIIVERFELVAGGPIENGVAFCLGLTAMNIVPGMLALADRWAKNPTFGKGSK